MIFTYDTHTHTTNIIHYITKHTPRSTITNIIAKQSNTKRTRRTTQRRGVYVCLSTSAAARLSTFAASRFDVGSLTVDWFVWSEKCKLTTMRYTRVPKCLTTIRHMRCIQIQHTTRWRDWPQFKQNVSASASRITMLLSKRKQTNKQEEYSIRGLSVNAAENQTLVILTQAPTSTQNSQMHKGNT